MAKGRTRSPTDSQWGVGLHEADELRGRRVVRSVISRYADGSEENVDQDVRDVSSRSVSCYDADVSDMSSRLTSPHDESVHVMFVPQSYRPEFWVSKPCLSWIHNNKSPAHRRTSFALWNPSFETCLHALRALVGYETRRQESCPQVVLLPSRGVWISAASRS